MLMSVGTNGPLRLLLDEAQQVARLLRSTAADQHRLVFAENHQNVAALRADDSEVVRQPHRLQTR